VLIADLDQFKLVNDSLGHQAGDELLRGVAPRFAAAVRETDTVARFGGDEFVVLCDGVVSEHEALKLAQRLAAALEESLRVAGGSVYVSASFGVAIADPESDAASLLRDADAALYRAKARGRGRCELFDAPMRARATARLELETGLRRAAERGEIALHYQPVVQLSTGRPMAFEALMRWTRPEHGPVSPAEFIPVAEESGLIVPLGRWAVLQACTDAASLGPQGMPVSVNLSPRQISHPGIVDDVATALERSGLDPSMLLLELTESALLEEADSPLPVLEELKALGVSLVLDDFGTGYSSLAYLQRFPLDGLKIDRAFVSGMTEDGRAAALVQAVFTMARSLGLTVVPEGIETEAQREALLTLGCRYGQGFLFGRPAAAAPQRAAA
jgi:diguanylate cyclase (GGDEF)-like protein